MTDEQKKAAMEVLKALADTIKEAPDGCPLGPTYAAFMSHGMSYDTFMNIIGTMESLGLIEIRNHCAYWVAGSMQ